MSSGSDPFQRRRLGLPRAIQEDIRDLRDAWLWFVLLGLLLIVLGAAALSYALLATEFVVLTVGWLLLITGAVYLVGAFFTASWGGLFTSLLAGALHLALGFLVVNHPLQAAAVYTLLLAAAFMIEGVFRIVAALFGRFRVWGWVLLSGVIDLALGIMIWRHWPTDALYLIGIFLGVNLIFAGWSYVWLGAQVRNLPTPQV